MNEPVTLSWSEVQSAKKIPATGSLRLTDESGFSLPFQLDDLDGDGVIDELSFFVSAEAGQERSFRLITGADSLSPPLGPPLTDAVNAKRVDGKVVFYDDDDGPGTLRTQSFYPFDGVGWESDVVGYRLYLDERNAMDIQAKRQRGLHWGFIGASGVNYQLDSYWGTDVLHVGPSFGIGGFGLWVNEEVVKPLKLARRRTRILARGPVRAVVRVDYKGWDVGGPTVDCRSIMTIAAGERIFEHRFRFESKRPLPHFVTGLVRHPEGSVRISEKDGYLLSFGPQSRTADNLLMILGFHPDRFRLKFQTEFDDAVVLEPPGENDLTTYVLASWEGETRMPMSETDVQRDLTKLLQRIHSPMTFMVE